jgi:hypothetical protein
MSTLESLRAKLGDISRRSEAVTAGAAAMDRPLTDEERAKLDDLAREFQSVEADIARLETIERQKASASGSGQTARPSASSARPSYASAEPDADPATTKRAESMLIALGVIVAVFALLSIIGGDIVSFIIQGAISLLTFLVGYKALKDGNINTARTFCLVMGWVYAGLQILSLLLVISVLGQLNVLFWIIWIIGWLFAWGYFYCYQCITPKAQRKMGL